MLVCKHCGSNIVDNALFCPSCGEKIGQGGERDDYEYEAFISYRHLPLSSKVAKRLQHDIEGFRIPKELCDERDKARLGRLFRDEDELPVSTSLSDRIQEALARSRYLIVVCEPQTRKSPWVEREIELFSSLHGRDRILVALAEGDRLECLPDILLYQTSRTEDGGVIQRPTEPLAADFRDASGRKVRDETLRIIAALLGCGFDDLRQRERARKRSFFLKIAALVISIAVIFAAIVIRQQSVIRDREQNMQITESRKLVQEVDKFLVQGERMQAIQAALDALPSSSTSSDRPYVPEARAALERALQVFPTQDGWYPTCSHNEGTVVDVTTCESLGQYAVLDSSGGLRVYAVEDGSVLTSANFSVFFGGIDPGGVQIWMLANGNLVAREGNSLYSFDPVNAKIVWSLDGGTEEYVHCVARSDDDKQIALCGATLDWSENTDIIEKAWIKILDSDTGKVASTIELSMDKDSRYASFVSLDANGKRAFAAFDRDGYVVDCKSAKTVHIKLAHPQCTDILWLDDGIVVSTQNYEEPSPVPAAVQRYDAKGMQVWRVDDRLSPISTDGVTYEETIDLWRRLQAHEDLDNRIVAAFGKQLITIDVQDGERNAIATLDSPVMDCLVTDDDNFQRLNVCTASGELLYMTLNEDGVSAGSDIDTDIGNINRASFVRVDGHTYLVAKRSSGEDESSAVSVWNLFSTGQLREGNDVDTDWVRPTDQATVDATLEDISSNMRNVRVAMRVPGSSNAVIQSDGSLLLVDGTTGDILAQSTITYAELHGCGFADNGRLFYAMVPITDDYNGRSSLYVFDLASNPLEPQSVIPFGVMLDEDGKRVLIDDESKLRTPTWTVPYPTLDELLEQGKAILKRQ